MEITKLQLKTLINNHLTRENGLHEVMEMMLNAMMKSERSVELERMGPGNKANGYRYGKTYGQGRILELRIPRDRNGDFYPKVLALLRSQQAETDQDAAQHRRGEGGAEHRIAAQLRVQRAPVRRLPRPRTAGPLTQ